MIVYDLFILLGHGRQGNQNTPFFSCESLRWDTFGPVFYLRLDTISDIRKRRYISDIHRKVYTIVAWAVVSIRCMAICNHCDHLAVTSVTTIAIPHYSCDKLDRICQVGFAGAWHWPASGRGDAYCDVFDVCACVWARVNGGPDIACVMEACLICVTCVNCAIWNLGIYRLLRFSGACNVCSSCVLWLDPSPTLVMSVSTWGC